MKDHSVRVRCHWSWCWCRNRNKHRMPSLTFSPQLTDSYPLFSDSRIRGTGKLSGWMQGLECLPDPEWTRRNGMGINYHPALVCYLKWETDRHSSSSCCEWGDVMMRTVTAAVTSEMIMTQTWGMRVSDTSFSSSSGKIVSERVLHQDSVTGLSVVIFSLLPLFSPSMKREAKSGENHCCFLNPVVAAGLLTHHVVMSAVKVTQRRTSTNKHVFHRVRSLSSFLSFLPMCSSFFFADAVHQKIDQMEGASSSIAWGERFHGQEVFVRREKVWVTRCKRGTREVSRENVASFNFHPWLTSI